MKRTCLASVIVFTVLATSAQAQLVNFNYTQNDGTTGSGSISPFTFMNHDFTATPMPGAVVVSPGGVPPAGFVGSINAQTLASNEPNQAVALLFSGVVTASSSDGFLIDIPLRFIPKQTQAPDVNDYTWSVPFGDSPTNGVDAVSSAAMRFGMWFSRDDVIDGAETPDTFQRYTQLNHSFVAGADSFTNTDLSTAPIKDATDAGAPAGVDAAGRALTFYYGWRDTGGLTSGMVLVDDFIVGGLLSVDQNTLRPIPEPSSVLLAFAASGALLLRRQRRSGGRWK